jgi:diguanylate cyclase (GGDEF)-like protein
LINSSDLHSACQTPTNFSLVPKPKGIMFPDDEFDPILNRSHLAEIDRQNADAWSCRLESRERTKSMSHQTLERSSTLAYRRGQGYAVRNLGFCAFQEADFETAFEHLGESLEIAQEIGDMVLERDSLNFHGAIYHRLGDLENALNFVQRTFALNLSVHDEAGIAVSLMNLGSLEQELGRPKEAIKALRDALDRSVRLGDGMREAMVLSNLGVSLTALEQYNEAVETFRRALTLCDDFDLTDLAAPNLVNLAEVFSKQKRFEEALDVIDQALEIISAGGPSEGIVHALLTAGKIHIARERPHQALEILESALSESQGLQLKGPEFQVHELLAKTYKNLNRYELALKHHESFHTLERQVRADDAERKVRAVAAQFEMQRIRAEAEIQRLRNVELANALQALEQSDREKTELLRALELKSRELEHQVKRDPLTGLYNRRHLETVLTQEFDKAKQRDRSLPVALIDIDHFKTINDTCSHQIGDEVLVKVAEILNSGLRAFDLAARYGGEEFVIVLPRTTAMQAFTVCERLRVAIQDFDWASIHPALHVTISCGISSDVAVINHERLLQLADDKLYQAKREGRNCVRE